MHVPLADTLRQDPSGGQYLETYVPKYGVIFASQNISPEQTIIQDRIERKMPAPTKEELREHVPELNRWSDVVWFLWAKYAGVDAKKIEIYRPGHGDQPQYQGHH